MPGDVLIALARFAGQTAAGAAITDVREAVRGRFACLLGRGDTRKTDVAERWGLVRHISGTPHQPRIVLTRPGLRSLVSSRADSKNCGEGCRLSAAYPLVSSALADSARPSSARWSGPCPRSPRRCWCSGRSSGC